jgi:hypothetical protein
MKKVDALYIKGFLEQAKAIANYNVSVFRLCFTRRAFNWYRTIKQFDF